MARQALNELVAVRQDKVGAIERRLEALEAHVQSLTQRYEVPAYPVGAYTQTLEVMSAS